MLPLLLGAFQSRPKVPFSGVGGVHSEQSCSPQPHWVLDERSYNSVDVMPLQAFQYLCVALSRWLSWSQSRQCTGWCFLFYRHGWLSYRPVVGVWNLCCFYQCLSVLNLCTDTYANLFWLLWCLIGASMWCRGRLWIGSLMDLLPSGGPSWWGASLCFTIAGGSLM